MRPAARARAPLFAFSSANWRRPGDEVSSLMSIFVDALDREVEELHRQSVRLRVIGDRSFGLTREQVEA